MHKRFRDRTDAGQQLAQQLLSYRRQPQTIILGLPRGGVPVAYPIAKILELPLDICLVHKLGVPNQPELAMGAIDLQGQRCLNERIVDALGISAASIDRVAESELRELHRRDLTYRGDRPPVEIKDQTIILVDDGLATGATMRAAIQTIHNQQPAQIIVAVPIACRNVVDKMLDTVDMLVCLIMPEPLQAIGSWYDDFTQTTDKQVCELLWSVA
jgi:putative phosphoribosyl transferase